MDYNLWQQLILGATKPFRTGANILAQNWGSALTGKDMSQEENQGKFLQWLAGGLTDEEQQVINDKPYLSALKSGAGMASTLAPFGTQGLRAAQFASNPLTNRLAQLASQGALEGGLGGFGYSREGKEVQDTLTGAGMGIGGELLADYITNPQFRKMLSDASTFEGPNGVNMYKGALGDDNTINFRKPHPKDNTLNTDNFADFIDTTSDSNAKVFVNTDVPEQTYQNIDEPIVNNWMDNIDESPEINLLKDDPIAQLEVDARYYSTPEEFVKAQGETVYRASPSKFPTDMWREGTYFAPTEQLARYYSESHLPIGVEPSSIKVVKTTLPKELLNIRNGGNSFTLKRDIPVKFQLEDIWKKAHPNELGNSLRDGFKEILKKSGLK